MIGESCIPQATRKPSLKVARDLASPLCTAQLQHKVLTFPPCRGTCHTGIRRISPLHRQEMDPALERCIVPSAVRKSDLIETFGILKPTPLLIRPASIKQGFQRGDYQQKVPLYVPSQIIKPKGPILFLPHQVPSLAQADPASQTLDNTSDEIRGVSDEYSMNRLSKTSEWSTPEDRAHCRDDCHPSLRSEDPSIKSGDLGPWWKGQRFRAVFKKATAYRPALESVNS